MLFPAFRSSCALATALLAGVSSVEAFPNLGIRASNSSSSTACNNSPELCSRQYNKITHMGAHDSSFLRDSNSGIAAAGTQYENATDALNFGLRLLQTQVHLENSTLELCHTSCSILDAGPLETWLGEINDWMTAHPYDVVTLLLVNSDTVNASEFGAVFKSSGLSDIAYTPTSDSAYSDWPTLQTMIDNKERLVVLITNTETSTEYPYLIPEFDYVFETPFTVTNLTGFNCTLDRPSTEDSASAALDKGFMGLANHFKYESLGEDIYLPDVSNIEIVNSAATTEDGNLGKHLSECKSDWSGVPTFVLVDFFNKGDVMKAADTMNGITNATGRTEVSDDESKGSRGDGSFGMGALIAFFAAAVVLL